MIVWGAAAHRPLISSRCAAAPQTITGRSVGSSRSPASRAAMMRRMAAWRRRTGTRAHRGRVSAARRSAAASASRAMAAHSAMVREASNELRSSLSPNSASSRSIRFTACSESPPSEARLSSGETPVISSTASKAAVMAAVAGSAGALVAAARSASSASSRWRSILKLASHGRRGSTVTEAGHMWAGVRRRAIDRMCRGCSPRTPSSSST